MGLLPTGHPRVGGEHFLACGVGEGVGGSSPRGRGTRAGQDRRGEVARVIPAWAGNTISPPRSSMPATGHPRVGGEHGLSRGAQQPGGGSSPRGRGTPGGAVGVEADHRVIPAWAGNTRQSSRGRRCRSGHPRVGGEHYVLIGYSSSLDGSSPRGRGTLTWPAPVRQGGRVIPAWAGNTGRGAVSSTTRPGHPRVGGEHSSHNYMFRLDLLQCRKTTGKMAWFCGAFREGHSANPVTRKQRVSIRQNQPVSDDCDRRWQSHSPGPWGHPKP